MFVIVRESRAACARVFVPFRDFSLSLTHYGRIRNEILQGVSFADRQGGEEGADGGGGVCGDGVAYGLF